MVVDVVTPNGARTRSEVAEGNPHGRQNAWLELLQKLPTIVFSCGENRARKTLSAKFVAPR